MKKTIIAMHFCLLVSSQNNISKQQIAYGESYKQEQYFKYDEAIKAIESVYTSESYTCNLRLGWLWYLKKDYIKSKNYYKKAISINKNAIEAKLGYIYPLKPLKDFVEIEKQYKAIIKIAPSNTNVLYNLGLIYYNKKDFNNAEHYLEKMVNLYPFSYDGVILFAWIKLKLGKTSDAKEMFNRSLLIRPSNKSGLEGLKILK